jgi:hypothetical protein
MENACKNEDEAEKVLKNCSAKALAN